MSDLCHGRGRFEQHRRLAVEYPAQRMSHSDTGAVHCVQLNSIELLQKKCIACICKERDSAIFNGMSNLPEEVQLQIWNCLQEQLKVDDEWLHALHSALEKLDELSLGRSKVTSETLQSLSGFSRLTALDLSNCVSVEPHGFAYLSGS